MATDAELARFRRMTDLESDDETYSDTLLDGMIEDLGFAGAAGQVWREKAASAATLVDTTESGSSRRLSGLKDAYLKMATSVDPADPIPTTAGRSFTVEIDRV